MDKDNKILLMAIVILLVGLVSFNLGNLTDNIKYEWDGGSNHLTPRGKCVQNCFKEDTIYKVDMLASCYKGCQFATQPCYRITSIKNKEERIELYRECSNLCESRYDK